jgi:hypothetical protein
VADYVQNPKAESLAIIREDSFDILPLNPNARCTPTSIAAHTLYEKTRPDILLGPGGALHLANATYEQLPDNRTVRVRGSKFVPSAEGEYTVKLKEQDHQDIEAFLSVAFVIPLSLASYYPSFPM